jgi:hypothetical protein
MIGQQPTGTITGVVIHAVAHEGLRVTVDGKPAQLAIVTDDGKIIARGQEVADEAENVSVNSYRAFLLGKGHVRVMGKSIEEIDTVGLAAEAPLNREHPKTRRVTKR